jgi:hypothetical protein
LVEQYIESSLIISLVILIKVNKTAEALVMEKQTQVDSSSSGAALDNTTLGINPSRYYRPEPRLGFTPFAELWNGRLAMVGIIVALAFELISRHAL